MYVRQDAMPVSVTLPDGTILNRSDLPSKNTTRWVVKRKAKVVLAVHAGLMTLEEALTTYNLSKEEFASWERAMLRHGSRGLRVTHLKKYRQL